MTMHKPTQGSNLYVYSPRVVSEWGRADRFSDIIVRLMNDERRLPDFSPIQMLAGMMLGMCAMAGTVRKEDAPPELIDVMNAIQRCLRSMMAEDVA